MTGERPHPICRLGPWGGPAGAGWALAAVALWGAAVLAARLPLGVQVANDSEQYLAGSVLRPPGYPFLLELFARLFADWAPPALVAFQLLCVLAAALHLSWTLWRRYALHPAAFVTAYVLLTLPLTSLSTALGIHGTIGNRLLTEAVTYALFLLVVSCLLRALFHPRPLPLALGLLLIALATLVRTQMFFLYPLAAAVLLWEWRHGLELRATLLLALSALLLVAGTDLAERLYHRQASGHFGRVSLGSSHFLVGALYMAPPQAAELPERESDREVLRRAYAFLASQKLHSSSRFELDRRLADLYNDKFAAMLNAGLMPAFNQVYAQTPWSDPALIALDRFSDRVAPLFLRHYPASLCKLFLLKLLYSLNFREGLFAAVLLLLPWLPVRRETLLLAGLVALPLLVNRLLLVPILYLGDRYLFYTDILEYVLLLAVADQLLRRGAGPAAARV